MFELLIEPKNKISLFTTSCRQLFLKDEELSVNDQECLLPTMKPVSLQRGMTGNDEEQLFDFE